MIAIIDCGSSKVPDIEKCITKSGVHYQTFKIESIEDSDFSHYDAFIISGAPKLFTEINPTEYLTAGKIIIESTKPVLGICFGHQLISMVFGGNVSLGNEDRSSRTIMLIKEHPLFSGLGKNFQMQEDHCEETSLPIGFVHVCTSETCEIEAFSHETKNIFGVQFHPEVSGENGQKLFDNFVSYYLNK